MSIEKLLRNHPQGTYDEGLSRDLSEMKADGSKQAEYSKKVQEAKKNLALAEAGFVQTSIPEFVGLTPEDLWSQIEKSEDALAYASRAGVHEEYTYEEWTAAEEEYKKEKQKLENLFFVITGYKP